MVKAVISKRSVDGAHPTIRKYILWDEKTPGFGLKVYPSGKKVYIFQYRLAKPGAAASTPPSTYTIGAHGKLTTEEAVTIAKQLSAQVVQGIDPINARRSAVAAQIDTERRNAKEARLKSAGAFDLAAENWLESLRLSEKSIGYYKTSRWAVRSYLVPALGSKSVPDITADDIQAALDAVPLQQRATLLTVFDTAFAIFKWLAGTRGGRLIARNTVGDVDRPSKPKHRTRVLSNDELAAVWIASEALPPVWTAYYRLAILTGKRRSELSNMEWSELNSEAKEWSIPASRSKNDEPDLVPLSDAAYFELQIMAKTKGRWPRTGYVFTQNGTAPIGNHSKIKRQLDAAIEAISDGVPMLHWTFHDIRRTLATGSQRLGTRLEVTEALMNHKGVSRTGVAGIYQHYDWKLEKREALNKWSADVARMVAVANSPNVVEIKTGLTA